MAEFNVDVEGLEELINDVKRLEEQLAEIDGETWIVGTGVDYAVIVEFGRGPVEAKDADALKFEIDGETIFRQSVGGADPKPFFRNALRSISVEEIIDQSDDIDTAVEKVAFGLEREVKEQITRLGAIDTGTLRVSVRAVKSPDDLLSAEDVR